MSRHDPVDQHFAEEVWKRYGKCVNRSWIVALPIISIVGIGVGILDPNNLTHPLFVVSVIFSPFVVLGLLGWYVSPLFVWGYRIIKSRCPACGHPIADQIKLYQEAIESHDRSAVPNCPECGRPVGPVRRDELPKLRPRIGVSRLTAAATRRTGRDEKAAGAPPQSEAAPE